MNLRSCQFKPESARDSNTCSGNLRFVHELGHLQDQNESDQARINRNQSHRFRVKRRRVVAPSRVAVGQMQTRVILWYPQLADDATIVQCELKIGLLHSLHMKDLNRIFFVAVTTVIRFQCRNLKF